MTQNINEMVDSRFVRRVDLSDSVDNMEDAINVQPPANLPPREPGLLASRKNNIDFCDIGADDGFE